jgi:hypothetical protein
MRVGQSEQPRLFGGVSLAVPERGKCLPPQFVGTQLAEQRTTVDPVGRIGLDRGDTGTEASGTHAGVEPIGVMEILRHPALPGSFPITLVDDHRSGAGHLQPGSWHAVWSQAVVACSCAAGNGVSAAGGGKADQSMAVVGRIGRHGALPVGRPLTIPRRCSDRADRH